MNGKGQHSSGPIGVKSIDTIETPRPEPFWPEIPAIYVYRWLSCVTRHCIKMGEKKKKKKKKRWWWRQLNELSHYTHILARISDCCTMSSPLIFSLYSTSTSLYLSMNIEPLSAGTPPVPTQKRVHTRAVACQPFHLFSLPFLFVCIIQWSRVKVKTYTRSTPPWISCAIPSYEPLWFQHQTVFPFLRPIVKIAYYYLLSYYILSALSR